MTQATPLLTQIYIFCLVTLRILLHAKFGLSSFTHSGDMEGSQNLKSRSRDPGHAPFDPIVHFLLSTPQDRFSAKFGVSSFVRYGNM